MILGIFNGQKHLPHKDSKVTQVLRECLGSLTCQATMLAHVSPEPSHYSETLHTVQLASRLHRMRRKRLKANSNSGSSNSLGGSSSDEHRRLAKFRTHRSGSGRSGSSGKSSSDLTSTNCSSSEMSCDTVVYRGHSDGSGTDSEHPPSVYLPASLRLLGSSTGGSAPGSLRGSFDDIPRRRKILTNGAISPRRNLSPQPLVQQQLQLQHQQHLQQQQQMLRSPNRSLSSLPVIHEVHTNSRRMPLNGLVPVPGRRTTAQQQQQQHSPQQLQQQQQEHWIDANPNYRRMQSSSPNLKPKNASNLYSTHKQQKEIWIDSTPAAATAVTAVENDMPQQQQQQLQPEIFQHLIQKTANSLNNNQKPKQQQQQVRKLSLIHI